MFVYDQGKKKYCGLLHINVDKHDAESRKRNGLHEWKNLWGAAEVPEVTMPFERYEQIDKKKNEAVAFTEEGFI